MTKKIDRPKVRSTTPLPSADPPPFKVVDIFCGAGGTSQGFVEACQILGMPVDLTAINHWQVAINTHTKNHVAARHLCTGIDAVNPTSLYTAGELGLLWASPECTHHSTARGGKPINDQSRATAWCVCRWAEALRPPVILLENVPEFLTWGPIDDTTGRPVKERKGEVFRAFKTALEAIGYRVDHRLIVCADYGDPTTRKRLFIQAVRGDRPIIWPNPTHVSRKKAAEFPQLRPWVTAREGVIDWSIPCPSIFDRKRPLSEKTMARILAGLRKFGLKDFVLPQQSNPTPKDLDEPIPTVVAEGSGPKLVKPFIIPNFGERPTQQPRNHSVDDLLPTVTGRGAGSLVQPFIVTVANGGEDAYRTQSIQDPLTTITADGVRHALAQPFLINTTHDNSGKANAAQWNAHSIAEPLGSVTSASERALVVPFILPQFCSSNPRDLDQPAPTVTTTSRGIGFVSPSLREIVNPYIVSWDHQSGTGDRSIDEPLTTISTKARHGVAQPFLVELRGTSPQLDATARDLDEPCGTITTSGGHQALIAPFLVQVSHGNGTEANGNERRVKSLDDPLPTVCGNRGDIALVASALLPQHSGGVLRSADEPAPTVTTTGAVAMVQAFIVKYYGTGCAKSVDDTLDTVTTKERFGLVLLGKDDKPDRPIIQVGGRTYLLEIGFRMLQPHELAAAQGFPPGYKFAGNKGEKVKQIGNAVPRHTARAIALAVLSGQTDISGFLFPEDGKTSAASAA